MSRSAPDRADDAGPGNDNLPARYEVGYGKPPTEHRFKKGHLGNPRGRPRGRQPATAKVRGASYADHLILEEAYRPVTVREGETTIEMPAIQAAMRALGISAMKGSRLAQRALAEMVRDAETKHRAETEAAMEGVMTYKQNWSQEIERCRRRGLPQPEMVPHPDDMMIDFRNGGVKVLGPLNADKKAKWDEQLDRRAQAQVEVNEYSERYRKTLSPKNKALWLAKWHFEQRIFDIINDSMPARYKAQLDNRSWKDGASREGKTLQAFIDDRKRPKRQRQWGDYVEE